MIASATARASPVLTRPDGGPQRDMRGGRAAPGRAVVDDVVVHDRRRVHQFERGGGPDHRVGVRLPRRPPAPVTEGGSESFSTGECGAQPVGHRRQVAVDRQ